MYKMTLKGKVFIKELCKEYVNNLLTLEDFKSIKNYSFEKYDDNIFYVDKFKNYSIFIQHSTVEINTNYYFNFIKIYRNCLPFLGTGLLPITFKINLINIYENIKESMLYDYIKDLKKYCSKYIKYCIKRVLKNDNCK